MDQPDNSQSSRRVFIKDTTKKVAAVSALAGVSIPHVHAQSSETIQVALVGCGGRGTGAAQNALRVKNGPIKLTAMADIFSDRLFSSYRSLKRAYDEDVDVPNERRFIGFNAYKEAIDSLNPGDVAIFATPPAFRWVHFKYAIEKGVNVFMEKPVTVDGPTTRRMIELAKKADEKNMKVGVGLMVRHCEARKELFNRIQDGEIGDLIMLRAYRMQGPGGNPFTTVSDMDMSIPELPRQIRRFHSFLWASGGMYSDYYIHQVDECCWMKNAWPVKAHAVGGRQVKYDTDGLPYIDQNFDHYGVEYTFDDGTAFHFDGRTSLDNYHEDFASYAHGSKGMGIISASSHHPGKCATFEGHKQINSKQLWAFPQPERNPYDLEWINLIDAIRNDKPHNEVERGAIASLVTSMGRMAAHTGQVVTYDQIFNSEHEFAPNLEGATMESPAPIQADAEGRYPIPLPGIVIDREYGEV